MQRIILYAGESVEVGSNESFDGGVDGLNISASGDMIEWFPVTVNDVILYINNSGQWKVGESGDIHDYDEPLPWASPIDNVQLQIDADGDGVIDVTINNDGSWVEHTLSGDISHDKETPLPWVELDVILPTELQIDQDGDGIVDITINDDGTWIDDMVLHESTEPFPWVKIVTPPATSLPIDNNSDGITDVTIYRDGTWRDIGGTLHGVDEPLPWTSTGIGVPAQPNCPICNRLPYSPGPRNLNDFGRPIDHVFFRSGIIITTGKTCNDLIISDSVTISGDVECTGNFVCNTSDTDLSVTITGHDGSYIVAQPSNKSLTFNFDSDGNIVVATDILAKGVIRDSLTMTNRSIVTLIGDLTVHSCSQVSQVNANGFNFTVTDLL